MNIMNMISKNDQSTIINSVYDNHKSKHATLTMLRLWCVALAAACFLCAKPVSSASCSRDPLSEVSPEHVCKNTTKPRLSIIGINVEKFRKKDSKTLWDHLLSQPEFSRCRPDIIGVTEGTCGDRDPIPGYTRVIQRRYQRTFYNSIWVKNDKTVTHVRHVGCLKTSTRGGIANRSAVMMEIMVKHVPIRLVLTHLSGGRFDDKLASEAIQAGVNAPVLTAKSQELTKILDAYDPHIIWGDFNSLHCETKHFDDLFAKHQPYQKLEPGSARDSFKAYAKDGHQYLKGQGYEAAYSEEEIGVTSYYGSTVDWVYYDGGRKYRCQKKTPSKI